MPDSRRVFLQRAMRAAGMSSLALSTHARALGSKSPSDAAADLRAQTALQIRQRAAIAQSLLRVPSLINNGDETSLPNYIASFTKGFAHSQLGEVLPGTYETLLYAFSTGKHVDFENIDRGSGMKLVNPEAAFAFDLEGIDSHCLSCPPAPRFSSVEAGAEMVELYWQALARDIPFCDYGSSPVVQAAMRDLSSVEGYQGPKQPDGTVSTATIFRGSFPGCLDGPYISQFLLKPVPMNSTWMDQRYRVPVANVDYLTNYPEWLVIQSGLPPYRDPVFEAQPRYISTGRGLSEWVHYDFLYQGFHNAALILLAQTPESILNTNPYYSPSNPYKTSRVQTGFSTFGAPHICGWLGRVTTAALQAAWYQKWGVHRRLRPEEFGGRVHLAVTNAANYPMPPSLLNSAVLAQVYRSNGTYLLPQSFAEGCPLHPAYPAGHATVAGACSALLKAFFDENGLITDGVTASADGQTLVPVNDTAFTVGGELNKLAFNIAMGRNFAGIHYRSDAMSGFRLGEDVAISMMQDLVNTFTEDFSGFQFTRLDGTSVTISRRNS